MLISSTGNNLILYTLKKQFEYIERLVCFPVFNTEATCKGRTLDSHQESMSPDLDRSNSYLKQSFINTTVL